MKDNITVFVNDTPVKLYRGMKVKHALIAFNQAVYDSATRGELVIEDADGFKTGLDGAVPEGARIYARKIGD